MRSSSIAKGSVADLSIAHPSAVGSRRVFWGSMTMVLALALTRLRAKQLFYLGGAQRSLAESEVKPRALP